MRSTQQTAAPAPAPNSTRDQVREQVRQSIQDANQAVRDANQAVVDANRAARDAGNGFPVIPPVPPVPPIPPIGGYTVQNAGGDGFGGMPPQVVDISIAFFITCAVMVIGWPLSRAFGKRIERRGNSAALDAGTAEQLQRIEHAVDAMAIEIERISESQRFMARLQDASADSEGRGVKLRT
jgi:hypothetical protein